MRLGRRWERRERENRREDWVRRMNERKGEKKKRRRGEGE